MSSMWQQPKERKRERKKKEALSKSFSYPLKLYYNIYCSN